MNNKDKDKPLTLKEYYTTHHWKTFRKPLVDDKQCKCEMCGLERWTQKRRGLGWTMKRFDIHHKTYHLFHEKREDVLVLCSSCHKFLHDCELMARTRGGVYAEIYKHILETTPWRFEKR